MITNNKFLISPNFAPQIYSIQTDKFDESYFFGVGDNILISGNIKASSYEPVEADENILSPFVALKSNTGGTDITCAIDAVFYRAYPLGNFSASKLIFSWSPGNQHYQNLFFYFFIEKGRNRR